MVIIIITIIMIIIILITGKAWWTSWRLQINVAQFPKCFPFWTYCVWGSLDINNEWYLSIQKPCNHLQSWTKLSLGQSERNFNFMRFTSSVAKSSAVFLQIHVPSPLPTQYNVERSKELCLDRFNTVCGVGGGGRDDFACVKKRSNCSTVPRLLSIIVVSEL